VIVLYVVLLAILVALCAHSIVEHKQRERDKQAMRLAVWAAVCAHLKKECAEIDPKIVCCELGPSDNSRATRNHRRLLIGWQPYPNSDQVSILSIYLMDKGILTRNLVPFSALHSNAKESWRDEEPKKQPYEEFIKGLRQDIEAYLKKTKIELGWTPAEPPQPTA
jgi:hypothetical protein